MLILISSLTVYLSSASLSFVVSLFRLVLVWYWHWWQGLWKFYGIKYFNIIKIFFLLLHSNIHSDICIIFAWYWKCIVWMHCKSLWIKASAKCINVNVNDIYRYHDIKVVISPPPPPMQIKLKYLARTVQWSFELSTSERSVSQTRDSNILVLLLLHSLLCLSWLDPVYTCTSLHPSKEQSTNLFIEKQTNLLGSAYLWYYQNKVYL